MDKTLVGFGWALRPFRGLPLEENYSAFKASFNDR